MTDRRKGEALAGSGRPTIGFITLNLDDERVSDVWSGAVEAARERDVSLVCLPGEGEQSARNVLYDLVSAESLDGLVTYYWWSSREAFEEVYERYRPLPVVNVMRLYEGYPGVAWDNRQGTYDLVCHLIEAHGYRRIAYIGLYQENVVAQERYQAYVDALTEHGIPLDLDLVKPADYPGPNFSGAQGVGYLLDDRGLQPGTDLEAVVSFHDAQALETLSALRERGVRVPQDVAIVGIDDLRPGAVSVPSLTTVAQPRREMGQRAVEMLLARLAGEDVPEQVVMPSPLITRESCGCMNPITLRARAMVDACAEATTFGAALAARRDVVISDIRQAAGQDCDHLDGDWAGQLLDAFVDSVGGGGPASLVPEESFLSTLGRFLKLTSLAGRGVGSWQDVMSAMRRRLLLCFDDVGRMSRAESLWGQARVAIGDAQQRALARRQFEAERQAQALTEIGASLIITFDVEQLMDVLAEEVPRLGIPSIYLALYENSQSYEYSQPVSEWSRLVLAYNEHGRLEIEDPEGQRFPSRLLLPAGVLPQKMRQVLVLEPLFFRERQLGFVLLEVGPGDGAVCESLRGQTSSALQGALLMQQVRQHALQLDTAVSETLVTVQEMQITVTQTAAQARAVADAAQQSADISQAGQAVVADTVAGMSTTQQQMRAIEQDILALSQRTAQIGGIIDVVKRIADQSHLLALNANIEAARFGKQGQAFAIVAKEMRSLAEQSREATFRVRGILTEIQRATDTAVMVTKEGSQSAQNGMELASRAGEAIRDLSTTIEKAAEAANQIASTTYQQSAGMSRLAEAMQAIKQASTQTTMSAQQTHS